MSQRLASRADVTMPDPEIRKRPIQREYLNNVPTRKGREQALEFFNEIGARGITPTRLRNATEAGELRRFLIAGHSWYADRDLFDWLMTLASGGAK